jgi:hypothetical protein
LLAGDRIDPRHAAGFVRQVLEQSAGGLPAELVTLRAAVVGGFPAGGLRRDRSATLDALPCARGAL